MTDTRALILQATVLGEIPRVHMCIDPLQLSDALASEMERALDSQPIKKWMENPRFYAYWKSCFETTEDSIANPPRPRPCLYMDGSKRYTLATVLAVYVEA